MEFSKDTILSSPSGLSAKDQILFDNLAKAREKAMDNDDESAAVSLDAAIMKFLDNRHRLGAVLSPKSKL